MAQECEFSSCVVMLKRFSVSSDNLATMGKAFGSQRPSKRHMGINLVLKKIHSPDSEQYLNTVLERKCGLGLPSKFCHKSMLQ